MNDNRSPIWDKKKLGIGIITLTLISVIFIITNILNSTKSLNVKTETYDAIQIKQFSNNKKEIKNVVKYEHYLPTDVLEKKEKIRYQKWLDEEQYLPDSVKRQKEEVEKQREEEHEVANSSDSNDLIATEELVSYESDPNTESSNGNYYGTFQLTAYTWTGNPCADGVYPSSGYTVACNDSNLWHKWIYIEGYGNYYVHDTGGMGGGVIDIYMDSYNACIQFGRRSANIYVLD